METPITRPSGAQTDGGFSQVSVSVLRNCGCRAKSFASMFALPSEPLRVVEAGWNCCREARKHSKELKREASKRNPGVLRIACISGIPDFALTVSDEKSVLFRKSSQVHICV